MTTQDAPNFEALTESYDVNAELVVRPDARVFLASRKNDGGGVLLIVARTPGDDEKKNALTHFAADAKLLAGLSHRNLVQVLDGRWLGNDTFALVTERVQAPTVEEIVAREELSFQRIASILQDVNGLLGWARTHGVVHRALSWSTVHVERGSDRAIASFEIRGVPVTGLPGADADARTIASLAWAMLAGKDALSDAADASLADLRPDLPSCLVEATDALLRTTPGEPGDMDGQGFIALVAMADALKSADKETERIRAEILEEEKTAQEEIASGRATLEQQRVELERRTTAEREELDRLLASEREALAQERRRLEEEIAEQREALAKERAELEEPLNREREELAETRRDLERERVALEQHQLAIEQQLAELELRRNELTLLGESGVAEHALEAPAIALPASPATALPALVAPALPASPAPTLPASPTLVPVAASALPHETPAIPAAPASEPPMRFAERWDDRGRRRSRWLIPVASVALVGAVVASAVAINRRNETATSPRATRPAATRTIDSVAGRIAPSTAPAATVTDSAGSSRSADSAAIAETPPPPRRRRVAAPVVPDTVAPDSAALGVPNIFAPDPAVRLRSADSIRSASPSRDSVTRVDSARRRDTTAPPARFVRPDSGARRDSIVRRDSVPRRRPDTLRVPDTTSTGSVIGRQPEKL